MTWLKVIDFREDEDILDVRKENDNFFSFFLDPHEDKI